MYLFFTTDIEVEEAKNISRTSKETILKFIHEELDDIMPYLPTRDELPASDNGRVTRGAACAFQARVYLYESNWPQVQEYAGRLINNQSEYGTYSLFGSYEGLFQSANQYNQEVILDYSYVPEVRRWEQMYHRAPMSKGANLNASAPTQELVDSYLMANGKTIQEDASYDENNPYINRDPRLSATVVYDGFEWEDKNGKDFIWTNPDSGTPDAYGTENGTSTGYYIRKYWDPNHEADLKQSTNIILLRYGDVLLMYAEALLEQNTLTETVWDETIGAIRRRAGFTDSDALVFPSISTDAMRELIRNERRCELAMEGIRYHDIVRWKAGSQYLNKVMHGAKFANNGTEYITLDTYKFNENKDYLWSVPQSQLDLNTRLRPNNPGY